MANRLEKELPKRKLGEKKSKIGSSLIQSPFCCGHGYEKFTHSKNSIANLSGAAVLSVKPAIQLKQGINVDISLMSMFRE